MSKSSREEFFIRPFLLAYESGSWADALHEQPDNIVSTKKAVDWFAKRKSDGKTLAIEHTIIQPFFNEKADFTDFAAVFLDIERDISLRVPGRSIRVFVPVGVLQNQPPNVRNAIAGSVHRWIESNRLVLPDGTSKHPCAVTGLPVSPSFNITLNINVVPIQHGSAAETGNLVIRRQSVEDNLDVVVENALNMKLAKLVNTVADKRILLFERQHMNLLPKRILKAIDKNRVSFPDLACVDEMWFVERIGYGTAFFGSNLHFEFYENGMVAKCFHFTDGKLVA